MTAARRRIYRQEYDNIISLANAGVPRAEIARMIGRPESTVSQVCRKAGLPSKATGPRVPAYERIINGSYPLGRMSDLILSLPPPVVNWLDAQRNDQTLGEVIQRLILAAYQKSPPTPSLTIRDNLE